MVGERELAADGINPSKRKEELGKQDRLIRVHSGKNVTRREGKGIYVQVLGSRNFHVR